jgi:hypothetical protein
VLACKRSDITATAPKHNVHEPTIRHWLAECTKSHPDYTDFNAPKVERIAKKGHKEACRQPRYDKTDCHGSSSMAWDFNLSVDCGARHQARCVGLETGKFDQITTMLSNHAFPLWVVGIMSVFGVALSSLYCAHSCPSMA